MSINSSRRSNNNKKESIYREIGNGRFIAIRTIDEIEDIIDTSEAYMTDPTVIFNTDNTKVLFYYNTKDPNEIEEMETLFKRTVRKGSTITLSDAFYLDESSGDDETYDLGGTYRFEKYDAATKTIIAVPVSINKQSTTYLTYDSRYWIGSLLWTTADEIIDRTSSYEIVNFLGNGSDNNSFLSVFGWIQVNDIVDVDGVGTFTVKEFKIDSDEGWERIVVKEPIKEIDLLGEMTHIRILRSDRNQKKKQTIGNIPETVNKTFDLPPQTNAITQKPNTTSTTIKIENMTKEQCKNTPNAHWMPSRRGNPGFCMEGITHQQTIKRRQQSSRSSRRTQTRSGY